ncbi:anti-sigma regulatory factor [Carboxydothermus pertinax]|nr:anti-sigma regulatory factor [Carboxydothermus pertinax]
MIIEIRAETDILTARQAGRELAKKAGFGLIDETRIVTAISELARNILKYAGTGTVKINSISKEGKKGIEIICEDEGPGIADLDRVLKGGFSTSGGLGRGISGTRELMDEFHIESELGHGTKVVVRKWLRN